MRSSEVKQNNKNVPSRFRIGTPGGDEMAILSTLMDISETLAIIADKLPKGEEDDADGE